jgi:putative ABC transport system substrate-binding protein
VDRRRFLLTSLAGAFTAPLTAGAQQAPKVWRVGYLTFAPGPYDEAFREGLRELGYVEGKNLIIEYRWARPDPGRFSTLAAELVAVGVDIIVARLNQAIVSAAAATTTFPIVGFIMLEPVETGIVKSLARPGGNVTGLTWEEGTEQAAKKLELFKLLVPKASRMAAFWNPTVPGLRRYWEPLKTAGGALGIAVYSVEYSRTEALDREWDMILKDRPGAVFFWGDAFAGSRRGALCDSALKNRLPTMGPSREWAEAGCLISYSASARDQHHRAAAYVDKILKGAKPADLPIEQPTKFELVINLKTAKALGLTIPPSLLLRADQVIE